MSEFDPSIPFQSPLVKTFRPDSPEALTMPPEQVEQAHDPDHHEVYEVNDTEQPSEEPSDEPSDNESGNSSPESSQPIIPSAVPLSDSEIQAHTLADCSPKWQQYTAQAYSDGKLLDIPGLSPIIHHQEPPEDIFNLDEYDSDRLDPSSDSAYIERAIDQIQPIEPQATSTKKQAIFIPIRQDDREVDSQIPPAEEKQSAFVPRQRNRRFQLPKLEIETEQKQQTDGDDKAINFLDASKGVPAEHLSDALTRRRREKEEAMKAERPRLAPDPPISSHELPPRNLDAVELLAGRHSARREKRRQRERQKKASGDRIEDMMEPPFFDKHIKPFLDDSGRSFPGFEGDYDVRGPSTAVTLYKRPPTPDLRAELLDLEKKDEKKGMTEDDLPTVKIETGETVKVHMDIYEQFPHNRSKWEEVMLYRFHNYPGLTWEAIIELESQPIEVMIDGKNVKVDDDIVKKYRDLPGKMTQMMKYRKIYPGFDLDFIEKLEKEQYIILNSFKKIKIHADILKKHVNEPRAWKDIMEIREYQWPGKTWEQIQEIEKESENERQLKMFQMQQEIEIAREQRQKNKFRHKIV